MEDFDMDSSESSNWIKLVIALKVTKGGLEETVIDGLNEVQSNVGSSCGLCKSEDVVKGCACPVCASVMNKIKSMHSFGKPTLQNLKKGFSITSPLEIGKLFLPREGYRDIITFDEIDLNGLINILLNCNHFCKYFTFTPQPKNTNCLLSKVRQIGRQVRHTSTYKVSDSELHDSFNTLITLLSDQQHLSRDQHAMEAVGKLNKLKSEKISLHKATAVELWKKTFDDSNSRQKNIDRDHWSFFEDALSDETVSAYPFEESSMLAILRRRCITGFINITNDEIRVLTTKAMDVIQKIIDLENDPKDTLAVADQMAFKWASHTLNGTKSVDSRAFSKYKYLFRVSLKNSDQQDILQMINKQFVSVTYVEQDREKAIQYIRQVLEKEMCCVIIDGISEWKKRNVNVTLPCFPSGWVSTLVRVQ